MPDKILLLPDALANQIAAGEVVQRPASVVKELMENAIDAGATQIKLIVRDAGKTLLQVSDNGTGMSETDARMCFERHATSKIKAVNDLFDLHTFGFRGEALASIAAVAQVEMKTRLHGATLGTHIMIEGMQVRKQQACQCPEGTNLSVKNLFYNVPARRNFLKTDNIEIRHIIDEFQRVVLAQPNIAFWLHHNDQELYNLPQTTLRKRVAAIVGNNVGDKLVTVEENLDFMRIHGFVGKPDLVRKTRGEQFLFVNERFIKSAYIQSAIVTAYDQLLPEKSYPVYALYLDIDPKRIDVNVHPTKQEIKFDDERTIYAFVLAAVRKALSAQCLVPSFDFQNDVNFSATGHSLTNSQTLNRSFSKTNPTPITNERIDLNQANKGKNENLFEQHSPQHKKTIPSNWRDLYEIARKPENPDEQEIILSNNDNNNNSEQNNTHTITLPSNANQDTNPTNFNSNNALFGNDQEIRPFESVSEPYQLHLCYILSPIKSGFILIDQQAASERVLYERYLNRLATGDGIAPQQLLFPQTIELPRADAILLKDLLPDLLQWGYDLRELGQHTFVVHTKPTTDFDNTNEQHAIESILDTYKQHPTQTPVQRQTQMAKAMAKNHALKHGQKISKTEMQHLTDQLFACEYPYSTPNGKPTFITYTLSDVDKLFKK